MLHSHKISMGKKHARMLRCGKTFCNPSNSRRRLDSPHHEMLGRQSIGG
ncbi:hypothetical protein [Azospirillum melinis]